MVLPPADERSPPLARATEEYPGPELEAQGVDVPVIFIGHMEHPSPN